MRTVILRVKVEILAVKLQGKVARVSRVQEREKGVRSDVLAAVVRVVRRAGRVLRVRGRGSFSQAKASPVRRQRVDQEVKALQVHVLPSRVDVVPESQVQAQHVLSLLQPVLIVRAPPHVVMTGSQVVRQHMSQSSALPSPLVVADSNKKSCFAGWQFAVNDWQYKTFC